MPGPFPKRAPCKPRLVRCTIAHGLRGCWVMGLTTLGSLADHRPLSNASSVGGFTFLHGTGSSEFSAHDDWEGSASFHNFPLPPEGCQPRTFHFVMVLTFRHSVTWIFLPGFGVSLVREVALATEDRPLVRSSK